MRGPARLARAMGAGPTSWASQVLRYAATHDVWMSANETRARIGERGVATTADGSTRQPP